MAKNAYLFALQAEIKKSMEKGQEEMRKGQKEMKNQIQSHVEKREIEIGDVKGEVERKIEEVEDKVQGNTEEVEENVQVKIGNLEKRFSELEDKPINFPANPELTYTTPTVKSLTFDG
ncbi:hypothetical protein AVEN_68297-1 [Araneus ventricosus]|uniref:Uncharacterized protein n=1 Tax=Araneus ventricosus TaxID=182803 RepID=A0A4Y2HLG5_ARAVE|nr:hypothetical protein AVEN_68297-1 [Araneus ventricosus]